MTRWMWELQRARWRLGMFGTLAAVLVLAVLLLTLLEIWPLSRDIAARRTALDARIAKLQDPPAPSADEAPTEVSADRRFFEFLHGFHSAAENAALPIPQISYQAVETKDVKTIKRYLLETTFVCTYLQMRSFLGELRRVPGVRCERVTISRQAIAATQLEVKLQGQYVVEVQS